MHHQLIQIINKHTPITTKQTEQLLRYVQIEEIPKDCVLLQAGQIANHIYFIDKGVAHSTRIVDAQDITRWFYFANNFATSYSSFSHRQPSEESIVTLSDCRLLSISYTNLQYLLHQDSAWMNLSLKLLGDYYINSLQYHFLLQTQSTEERYQSLLKEHPDIIDKVPLGNIASFLGMSQSTLSRLRHKNCNGKALKELVLN